MFKQTQRSKDQTDTDRVVDESTICSKNKLEIQVFFDIIKLKKKSLFFFIYFFFFIEKFFFFIKYIYMFTKKKRIELLNLTLEVNVLPLNYFLRLLQDKYLFAVYKLEYIL